ncbi:MAG: hypothetical protein C0602_03500 [Denitrovibrio sp.]|nr:MAG: hypothetical protein C0602_03500 [Denitrovibrio sp.]
MSGQWHNLAITIIPNMLGFTLGGYAILLSFGGERFFKILCIRCADESTPTPFMIFNGAFVHFIIVQITTLLLSVLCSQYEKTWILVGFIGTFLLYYTLTTALAAVFAIMNMADWYEDQANNEL